MYNRKMKEINDGIYAKLIEEMEPDKSKTLNWFKTLCGIPIVYKTKKDERYQNDIMHAKKSAMNARLDKYDVPMQLQIIENNNTIMLVKKENARITTIRGVIKNLNAQNALIKREKQIANNPNSPKDQILIAQDTIEVYRVAKLTLHSRYEGDTRLDKPIRKEILALPQWAYI
jgi:hypothetical protein